MFSERLDTWLRDHALLVDALGAGALVAVIGLVTLGSGAASVALTVVLLAPLAWRRSRPVASAAVVCAAALVQLILTPKLPNGFLPADIAVPLSIYAVTSYGPRWAANLGLASGLVGSLLAPVAWKVTGESIQTQALLSAFLAATVVTAWAFGTLRRVRLEQVQALRDRARLLEVERDQQSRLAVSIERARIAREMHDIVAHSLAVVIAQADGGRYAAGTSPQAARDALGAIGETGRRALAEMRHLLGVLRSDGAGEGAGGGVGGGAGGGSYPPGSAALGPQPGAGDVAGLVEQVRSGGLAVRFDVEGLPRPLTPGVDLAVYRIVQEGLTNVLKHAGPTAGAHVLVRWRPSEVQVEVLDDGRGAAAPSPGGGHGLVGMRERVSLYGGWLATGPRVSGGYAVRAVLPDGATAPGGTSAVRSQVAR